MTEEELKKLFQETDSLIHIYEEINPIFPQGFETEKVHEAYEKMMDFIIPEKKDAFLSWMDKNDFWKTPASTRFHGNFEGGLAVHTLQVIYQCLKFTKPLIWDFMRTQLASKMTFTAKDIFISAMVHDFCKADSYEISFKNTKDFMGNWVKKPYFKTKDALRSLGHGNESVLRLLEIAPEYINNRLVLEAVSRHMGFSDLSESESYNYSNFLTNPLVLLLQLADQTAASWYEN